MDHIDLFSGIGGFALSARWAGIKTVQFVEIDKFCHKVLNKNFPGVPIHNDIKTFHYSGARPFILTGGFPCQPFSCAGKRRGKEDDRFLWPEMLRVVSEVKPRWIIGENVAGFVDMGLDDCISDLENQGYEVQPFIVPACALNAPHRRDRVWICAHSLNRPDRAKRGKISEKNEIQGISGQTLDTGMFTGTNCHAADTAIRQRLPGHKNESFSSSGETRKECGGGVVDATDTSSQRLQRCEWSGSHEQRQAAHGSTTERNHAWDEPWIEAASRLCLLDARLPAGLARPGRNENRVQKLKALGNAIVPQIAYQIMKAIIEVDSNR